LCQAISHFLKDLISIFAGFALIQFWLYILSAIPISIFGNQSGKVLLNRIPEKTFLWILGILITILGIQLLLANGFSNIFDEVIL